MATSSMLKAKGLNVFSNFLSNIPEGSLFEANNVNIDRDGILEPRRGIKTFKTLDDSPKSLLTYKDQLLVHYNDKIDYQTAVDSTTFSSFKIKKFFSITSATNYISLNGHGLTVDDPVTFIDIAGASGITVGPTYYVVSLTANTFSISSTISGSAITFTTGTTGQGTISYDYPFDEVDAGLRIKGVEFNGNLYITTNDGIKKISSLGDYYVTSAGGIAAFDIDTSLDLSTESGFFGPLYDTALNLISSDVEVAYRVTWGTKDVNTNLIEGAPSARTVITNRTGTSRNVNLNFTVPSDITTDYFFRVYRTNVAVINGSGDEMRLVFEAPFNTSATTAVEGYDYNSATSTISLNDSQTEELRNNGINLYTNETSGEGIAQANNKPPVAKDIAVFKNVTFYANTRTAYKKDVTLLGFDNESHQSITFTGNTVVNATAHGLVVGDYVAIAGTDIDGVYAVTAPVTANTFTIVNSTAPNPTAFGGAVLYKSQYNIYKNRATVNEIVRRYFLVGRPEKWDAIALSKTATVDGDYFHLTSYDDKNAYTFWIAKGKKLVIDSANDIIGSSDKINSTAHGLSDGDVVHFTEDSAGLPSQLVIGTNYYIVSSAANEFKLAFTPGGTPINFDNGTPGQSSLIRESTATAPVIANRIIIKIDITNELESATAAQIAQVIASSLDATADFSTSVVGSTITISTATSGKVTDVLSGTMVGSPLSSITKTQDGHGEDTTKNFVRLSSYTSPSLAIEDTAKSLVNVLNRDILGVVNAYYTSGSTTLPGQFNMEAKTIDAVFFEIIATNGTNDTSFGKMFNPDLTSFTQAENDVAANKIYFSKVSQPEAVPISNSLTVGPKNKAILRILGLRDSLFILKEEGIYRLTGFNSSNFSVALFDNSASITAPDSAAILNNNIYCLSTQGISTISETGVGVISRPIENLLNEITAPSFTNYPSITFGVTYEADRSYLLWVPSINTDTYATKVYRYNTFTQCWTSWNVNARCGVVDVSKNKLYIGSGDIDAIEVERKTLTSRDYSDREYTRVITNNSTDGVFVDVASNISQGDILMQTQYLSIAVYNRMLAKLSTDPISPISFTDLTAGASMANSMNDLLATLRTVDPTSFNPIIDATSEDNAALQTKFNDIIAALNNSTFFGYSDYRTSSGSTTIDLLVSSVNKSVNELLLASSGPYLLGDVTHYKAISSSIIWAPIALGEPSMSKHVRSGTVMLESNGLFGGKIGYASDISGNFEDTDFGMDGSGVWGASIFGNTAWGGLGTSYPLRTIIPRQKQRCRYLQARFKHNTAMFKYSILGTSYTFEMVSDRAWR